MKKMIISGQYFLKRLTLFSVLAVALLSFGCAKSVTEYVNFGDQMVVEVTMRGKINVNSDRYFLVVSSNREFKIALPPPDNITYEFIEPGQTPNQGAPADYYTNFYSTWNGYTIIDPAGYSLIDGPFVLGGTNSREVLAPIDTTTNKMTFVFRLSDIFGTTLPSTVYFDFVTVPWPDGQPKLAADHLFSTNAYISSLYGSETVVIDEANQNLDPAVDIISCKVTIQ